MSTYLEELSLSEAEEVKRTIRDLFRQTCILQTKYDPATLTPRITRDIRPVRNTGHLLRIMYPYLDVN